MSPGELVQRARGISEALQISVLFVRLVVYWISEVEQISSSLLVYFTLLIY